MVSNPKPQRPRQGWIYKIDPHRVSISCKAGHTHFYHLEKPGIMNCKTPACSHKVNSSRIFRGFHPYIIWTSDQFQSTSGYIETFTTIPLTSKPTYAGLPTTYPINITKQNGLEKKSYALVHQICTIDAGCFKSSKNHWLERKGQLSKKDKSEVSRRLRFLLDLDQPNDDWFQRNASSDLIQKIYPFLNEDDKARLLENLIDDLL